MSNGSHGGVAFFNKQEGSFIFRIGTQNNPNKVFRNAFHAVSNTLLPLVRILTTVSM